MADSSKPEDRSVTVNNLKLHYLDWGNEKMPALFFLPGLSSNAHDWDFLAGHLQGKYHCIALDQRGQGDSQWADSYNGSDFASDIACFVDALNLDRVSLVGHSLGGRTAMFYAASYPEKMAKLVIVDIGPEVDTSLFAQGPPPPRTRDTFDSLSDFVAFQRQRFPLAKEEPLRHYATYSTKKLPDGRLTYKHDPKLEKPVMNMLKPGAKGELVPWSLVAQVKCPTLIVRGAESLALSPDVAQRMVATMAQAELVEIEGAGHGIHLENPDQFNQAVLRFFGVV